MPETDKLSALITIIVPAYNVEKYIEKCLTSILSQSYSNIEVIVVNDGSSDGTKAVIERILEQDKRLVLIDQINTGVSGARNNGIRASTGDYLVFVDGDDYLAADYIEYMLGLIDKTGAEFCLSKCCYTKRGERQTVDETVEKLTPEAATALLLSPTVMVGCWNKIYRRSLLIDNHLWFSASLFYGEGLFFITTAAQISASVGIGNRKVYYYRRNNTVSATSKFDIQKIYNGETAIDTIQQQLRVSSSKIDTMLDLHRCMYYANALVKIRANHVKKQYAQDNQRWTEYLRKKTGKLLSEPEVSLYRKILLIGICIHPWIVMKMDFIRRKRICGKSVD